MSFPLSGTVSKACLLVSPAYAQEPELLHLLKYKLYDAGFIVVREEHRRVNEELAQQLCVQLDRAADSLQRDGEDALRVPESLLPTPSDLTGSAYVFVLAHRNCHAVLSKFVLDLLEVGSPHAGTATGPSYTQLIAAIAAAHGRDGGDAVSAVVPPAIFVHRTAHGARRAVALLFPRMLAEDVPTAVESREYVQVMLKGALLPLLEELSRKKPEDPIRWLAEQLLLTNPQSPPLVREGV